MERPLVKTRLGENKKHQKRKQQKHPGEPSDIFVKGSAEKFEMARKGA